LLEERLLEVMNMGIKVKRGRMAALILMSGLLVAVSGLAQTWEQCEKSYIESEIQTTTETYWDQTQMFTVAGQIWTKWEQYECTAGATKHIQKRNCYTVNWCRVTGQLETSDARTEVLDTWSEPGSANCAKTGRTVIKKGENPPEW